MLFRSQYLGSTPERRSERTREMRDEHRRWLRREVPSTPFITLDEFKRRFAAWVQEYVQQPHEELKERETGRVCSPAQRAAERQLPIRLPDPRSLAMLAWPRFERVVRKGMVGVDKHFYAAPELLALEGKRVELARDPANILAGVVYGQGKIFNVAAKARLPFIRPGVTDAISLDQVKEANRRQRDEEKLLRDARKAREARLAQDRGGLLPRVSKHGGAHGSNLSRRRPITASPVSEFGR